MHYQKEVVEPKNATEIPEKTNVTEETIENIVLPEKVRYALLALFNNLLIQNNVHH